MFDPTALTNTKIDIKLNNKSIKADLKRWLKDGEIIENADNLIIQKPINKGFCRLTIKGDLIVISNKKPSKADLLLKSLEVFD
jgi:hypothetical protein